MNQCVWIVFWAIGGLIGIVHQVNATLIGFVLEGQLQATQADYGQLDGARIRLSYTADSQATPTNTRSFSGGVTSFFDVFTMTCQITDRPDGADDILNLSVKNDPMAINFFESQSDNDRFTFDSRTWMLPMGDWDEIELDVSSWGIEFSTNGFFGGTDAVPDLTFLDGMNANDWVVRRYPEITEESSGDEYSISEISLTFVPEPATIGLLMVGGILLRKRLLLSSTRI